MDPNNDSAGPAADSTHRRDNKPYPLAKQRAALRAKAVAMLKNDTAAALQALRAAGVRGRAIDRGVAFLRRHQNRDGGFELTEDRGSDTQSTAWAIQGLLAAGRAPGKAVFTYLAKMRRPDGSYRYNARYVTTPLWVTSQVLPALHRRPFPLSPGG